MVRETARLCQGLIRKRRRYIDRGVKMGVEDAVARAADNLLKIVGREIDSDRDWRRPLGRC